MAQEDKVWWYATGDQKFGPYSAREFKAVAVAGKFVSTDLVWKEGLAKWVLASSIKGLMPPAPANMPPPLPATQSNPPSPNPAKPTAHAINEDAQKESQRSERSALNPDSSGLWEWNNIEWYLDVIRKYAVFDGRTGRKAYWMFVLFNSIIYICIAFVAKFIGGEELTLKFVVIYNLAVLMPSLAVAVRRMHDIGRTGWWILFPLVNIFFLCKDSQPGENEYGQSLKRAQPNQAMATAHSVNKSLQKEPQPSEQSELNFDVPETWKQKFKLIEKSGGPSLKKMRELSYQEKRKVMFNGLGFLFGPFYYLVKRMWKKAIILTAIGVVAIVILEFVLDTMGIRNTKISSFVIPAIFANRANIDYYKKMVLSDNGWW